MDIPVDWSVYLRNRHDEKIGREIDVEIAVRRDRVGYRLIDLCSNEVLVSDPEKHDDATDAERLLWDVVQKEIDTNMGLQALIVAAEREMLFETVS